MALRGSTQTLTATFYDSPGGAVEDPTSVSLSIYLDDALVAGPITNLIKDGTGLYRYEYVIPLDAALGTYSARWTSIQPGDTQPSVGYSTFEVTSTDPTLPEYGGCVWPMDPACDNEEWQAVPTDVRQRSLALASSTLERLSGYRVGNCPITVRPQPVGGFCGVWQGHGDGLGSYGGYWAVRSVGSPSSRARTERGIRLPAPVGRVDEVKVDGVVIDAAKYHVEGDRLIWHSTEPNPFPQQQNLDLNDTEVGTFSVTYLNAYPVDLLGAYAVGVLALEFAKACTGNRKCRLPDSVTSIVRQGVSMEITPGAFTDGATGIREVDTWIGLWNPGNLRHAVKVYSPDLPKTNVR